MKFLMSQEYKIPIVIEGNEVVAYAVDLSSGDHALIAKDKLGSFSLVYEKIKNFIEKNANKNKEKETFDRYFLTIILHVEQYRNNLYGFYLARDEVDLGNLLLLQMSYIEHFMCELSSLIFSMNSDDLSRFEEMLLGNSSKGDFYSEIYYLNDIYKVLNRSI